MLVPASTASVRGEKGHGGRSTQGRLTEQPGVSQSAAVDIEQIDNVVHDS